MVGWSNFGAKLSDHDDAVLESFEGSGSCDEEAGASPNCWHLLNAALICDFCNKDRKQFWQRLLEPSEV